MGGFDYYYGAESEQFAFYRIPRALMKEKRFKKLSSEAKILYGLMLDRMSLSAQNGWIDKDNRVFIYYTFENIMDDLGCAREKCTKTMHELDDEKGIGLIRKKRQGQGKPSRIYVMNFATVLYRGDSSNISENVDDISEVRKSNFKDFENRTSKGSESELQEVRKSNSNYTEYSKTNGIILSDPSEGKEYTEDATVTYTDDMIDKIREQIDYDSFMTTLPDSQKERFLELYRLICDVVCVPRKEIAISGVSYPYQVVRSRFLKLRGKHIEYVMECMEHNISNIRNIRAYLLTSLYHAPETVEHYWQQRVSYDMAHTDWSRLRSAEEESRQQLIGYDSG